MYYVYVLLSKRDKLFYIGYSADLSRRLKRHQVGRVEATKHRLPVDLIFYESYTSIVDAKRREKYFKTTKGKVALRMMLRETLKNLRS